MATLSATEVAQIAYQAGWRGDALTGIVAIARRESGYKSDAHRTDRDPSALSGDMGLTQINYTNADMLQQAGIISSRRDLFDPVVNMRAALHLYQQSGWFPWSMGPGGWTADGDPFYGTNRSAAAAAVQQAADQGLLGQGWQGSTATGSPTGAATPARPTGEPLKLPSDAKIYNIQGTWDIYAVFDVGGGVTLAYKVDTSSGATDWKSRGTTTVDKSQWDSMSVVVAGDDAELATLDGSFDTYKQFWDSIVDQVMGPYNPAKNDPEVLRVLAEFAARPDMTEAELQAKLQRTQWYRTRTERELEWNGLSQGEQEKRRAETAQQVIDTWWQFAGVQVDERDPRVRNYIEDLASGKMGWGAFTALVKDAAGDNPESPWSREVRTEEEAQRQRGVDVENTAQRIRDQLGRWGVDWTQSEVMRWAKDIVEKRASDQDLLDRIKNAAQVLYPWKDRELETLEAAQPWLSTYERLMEQTGSLQTRDVQRALTQGTPVFEFEKDLRKTDQWLTTKNARDELSSMASEVGRRMGFV